MITTEEAMKLYYAPGACSLASHIVLRETERRFDLERVDLATQRTASGLDYHLINPKRAVPALQLDGSETLTESAAILQYLGDLAPDRRLVPPHGTYARYHLQEWLSFVGAELHAPFSQLRARHAPPAAYAARVRGTIGEHLLYLTEVLEDRGFLMGETFTVADAYLFAVLQWTEPLRFDLQIYPNLDDYEFRIAQRPSVRASLAAEGVHGRHHFKAA
jgi:glutathione S-transferase